MRKLYVTDEDFPPSGKTMQAAMDAGAAEIVHVGDPGAMGLDVGYHEVAEKGDSLADKQADALARLAARRFAASQTVRCDLLGPSFTAPCDLQAGVNVTAAIVGFQLPGGPQQRKWKCGPDDWRAFGMAELSTLGQLMAAHVQACFDHEAQIAGQIAATQDAKTLAGIDLEAGWP